MTGVRGVEMTPAKSFPASKSRCWPFVISAKRTTTETMRLQVRGSGLRT